MPHDTPSTGPPADMPPCGPSARVIEVEAVYDSVPIGIAIFDVGLRYVRVNRCLAQINGMPPEAHVGLTVRDVVPTIAEQIEPVMKRVLESGEPIAVDVREKRSANPDAVRFFSERWFPMRDAEGRISGVGVVVEEITGRKAAEEKMRGLNRDLEERVAALTEDAEALTGELQRLALDLTGAEHRERRRLSKVLHDHIQQLLVAAQINVSTLPSNPRSHQARTASMLLDEALVALRDLSVDLMPPVLLERGLGPAIEWLADRCRERFGHSIDVQFHREAEPKNNNARLLLFDCVREALFNSIKHSGVKEARVTAGLGPDQRIRIKVTDTGVGFNTAILQNCPERSLGLYGIRQRLQCLGGGMEIDSAPGVGTRVMFIAPRATGSITIPDASGERSRAVEGPARPDPRGPSIRALVVVAQEIMGQALAELIGKDRGIAVVGKAPGGEEAFAMARDLQPDVVVMHVASSATGCRDGMRAIVAAYPRIPVICLLANDGNKLSEAMRRAGAADCLPKAARTQDLIEAIYKATRERKPPTEPTGVASKRPRQKRGGKAPSDRARSRKGRGYRPGI